MIDSALSRYLADGFDNVEGWCTRRVIEVTECIADLQAGIGVRGGACEIGVYRGKFFIGLANILADRPAVAIDIFDNQQLNVDKSGGNATEMLEIFRRNVQRHAAGPERISEIIADSLGLTIVDAVEIIRNFGQFQLFSIDGGHTPEHVVNDFALAQQLTHLGGAIIIDDVTTPAWPGVIEGVVRILTSSKPKFVPLLMGHNKLFLTGMSYQSLYLAGLAAKLKEKFPGMPVWRTRFCGYDLLSLV